MDIERCRREVLRWRILQTLNVGRPYPVSENIILATVSGEDMPVTPRDIRVEMDYLEARGLVEVTGKGAEYWTAHLTRYGVDLVEYTVECEPGIARPRKYW